MGDWLSFEPRGGGQLSGLGNPGPQTGTQDESPPQFHSGLRAQAGADWAGGGILQKMATFKVSVLSLYFFIWLWGGCIKTKQNKTKQKKKKNTTELH